MKQFLFGLVIFLVGLGLLVFSQVLARVSRTLNKHLGTRWPLKLYRIMNVIAGILWMAYGLLVMLGIQRLPF